MIAPLVANELRGHVRVVFLIYFHRPMWPAKFVSHCVFGKWPQGATNGAGGSMICVYPESESILTRGLAYFARTQNTVEPRYCEPRHLESPAGANGIP